MRNLAIDRKRATVRVELHDDAGEAAVTGQELFAQLDEAMIVHEAMAGLPENCREILDRFFAQDQGYRTIAEDLEIAQGTIASRISRCLTKLRDKLQD